MFRGRQIMKSISSPKRNGDLSVSGNERQIMLVDDHPVMREGLAQMLNHEPDMTVCGQFENAARAFAALAAQLPDLVIVDLSLKGSSGLELVKDIKASYPKLKVLVLSMYDESLYAERVLRAGGAGYIMKEEATEQVLGAIRKVLNGDVYLSGRISSRLMHQLVGGKPPPDGSIMGLLSDRELEVFDLIGQGKGTRQIAEQLHLSVKTVESHRAHIKEKLHIDTAVELAHRAFQLHEEQVSLSG